MNQSEYKHLKALLTRLETETYCRNWQHIYNIVGNNIPHYTRYARTEAAHKRCIEAASRFNKLQEKMETGRQANEPTRSANPGRLHHSAGAAHQSHH